MSLTSFLLGSSKKKSKILDTELDALFQSNPLASSSSQTQPVVSSSSVVASPSTSRGVAQKRAKPHEDISTSASAHPAKRSKAVHDPHQPTPSEDAGPLSEIREHVDRATTNKHSKVKDHSSKEADTRKKEKGKTEKKAKKDKKGKAPAEPDADTSDSEDEIADLEDAYLSRIQKKVSTKRLPSGSDGGSDSEVDIADSQSGGDVGHVSEGDASRAPSPGSNDGAVSDGDKEDDDEDDDGSAPPLHESLTKSSKRIVARKTKYIPPDETPAQRDARTIFVGNLPLAVAQKKSHLKQLQRHILAYVPTAKIESTRFRSVPFQAPTSKLADEDSSPSTAVQPNPNPRNHDRERASAWRTSQSGEADTGDAGKSDAKRYLTPAHKKRVAFITHAFHSSADTVHAYVVFAHPPPPDASSARAPNVPPPPLCMDPYAAAKEAAHAADGTMFMERAIRVDLVRRDASAPETMQAQGAVQDASNPKLSVFVGNLDFASKEEDLRAFFEGVIAAERGPPSDNDESNDVDGGADEVKNQASKTPSWVTHVRIVRDRDTQLGKGFAYVEFADRECVDHVLTLEAGTLKFAKRKLRVQRCKTLPGAPSVAKQKPQSTVDSRNNVALTSSAAPKGRAALANKIASVPIVVPAGDPSLGARLAHLPKDARKQVKATDADRVARRLAKKKARMAMASNGHDKVENGKPRERVRPKKGTKGDNVKGKGKGEKRSRVRSERSLQKRNAKK